MGSFQSTQSRDERRRSNRLSKPPVNKSSPSPITPNEQPTELEHGSPVSPSLVAWQNPWTGITVPDTSPDHEDSRRRVQSFSSFAVVSERPLMMVDGNKRHSLTDDAHDNARHLSRSSSRSSRFPLRRSSFQPALIQGSSQPSLEPERPKRSHSIHSTSQARNSAIHASAIEQAASSNTYFLVDSQRFSLMRRRSLLTRPGIATRRPRERIRRLPSPIGQESDNTCNPSVEASRSSQWPLPGREEVDLDPPLPLPHFGRPSTPSDFEYTHLGALKLGSLRVVNGSASPCPSDRTSLPRQDDEAGMKTSHTQQSQESQDAISILGSFQGSLGCPAPSEAYGNPQSSGSTHDHRPVDTEAPIRTWRSDTQAILRLTGPKGYGTVLDIPYVVDGTEPDDDGPKTPFSFEKSPTISHRRGSASDIREDEGIALSEHEIHFNSVNYQYTSTVSELEKAAAENGSASGVSRPLNKVDSGYSSATSVRSLQESRPRLSVESQASVQPCADSRSIHGDKLDDFEVDNDQADCKIQRNLVMESRSSLKDFEADFRAEMFSCSVHEQNVCSEGMSTANILQASRILSDTALSF